MGFWDKVKGFFGGKDAAPGPGKGVTDLDPVFEEKIRAAILAKIEGCQMFVPVDVADAATADVIGRSVRHITDACAAVEAFHRAGLIERLGYTRTMTRTGGGPNWVYHPVGEDPHRYAAGPPAPRAAAVAAPAAPRAGKVAVAAAAPVAPSGPGSGPAPSREAYAAPDILGLSADEMRKRALRIDPYRTAWIGRVDTIPPQSDERTALIDRGLVLRGLLTEEQIAAIHEVGDQWLVHHEAAKLAAEVARAKAKDAVEALRSKRAERKARKKAEAAAREQEHAAAVAARRAQDIVYLGPGVSRGLADRRSHLEELERLGLPVLSTPADVAAALGLPVPKLRWLCFHSEAAARPHYVTFDIPKRSGGMRRLACPQPLLATAQRWVLDHVLARLPVEAPAHGFVRTRSTVTNATPHVGSSLVVNLDLQDFFPTITFPRVRGMIGAFGYSPAAATILALLCTESPRTLVEHDGEKIWVAVGPRALPQGACTSPALSNQIARKLDRRLTGVARVLGWAYTRYADDLTFSARAGAEPGAALLLARVRHVVEEEGFALNRKKGRLQRRTGRQTVTGIVVNERPGLPRHEVRRLRAILHAARKTGLPAQNREVRPNFEAWLRGKLAYLAMVERARGVQMLAELDRLVGREPKSS
jgi:retron-type reverse transcriptase